MSGWNEGIKKELGCCGENVFIGHNVVFTSPKDIFLGDNVRIDPFVLITTELRTGSNVHIAAHAVLSGGNSQKVIMGNWTYVGYGVKLFTANEDYTGEYGPVNVSWGKNKVDRADIYFADYSLATANSIIMPGVNLPEGCVVGAMSYVSRNVRLRPWSIFFGRPAQYHGKRDRENCVRLAHDPEFSNYP